MTYKHTEEILNENSPTITELDDLMRKATYRTVEAINKLSESFSLSINVGATVEERNKNNSLFETFLLTSTLILKSFLTTHTSIEHIHKLGNLDKIEQPIKNQDKKLVMIYGADAMSLAREQVEKVFLITLLCEDPIKWIEIYVKDEWKHWYEYELHLKKERQNLPNFAEYYNEIFPQKIELKKQKHTICDKEQEATDYKFNNPNIELPTHLKAFKVETFPNPGVVKKIIKNSSSQKCLERWHWEYKYYCGFNHIGMSKMEFLYLSDRRFNHKINQSLKEEVYNDKIFQPSMWISYTASANAITEVFGILQKYAPNNIDVYAILTELWETLQKRALIAKAIWNIRMKDFFPLIF